MEFDIPRLLNPESPEFEYARTEMCPELIQVESWLVCSLQDAWHAAGRACQRLYFEKVQHPDECCIPIALCHRVESIIVLSIFFQDFPLCAPDRTMYSLLKGSPVSK